MLTHLFEDMKDFVRSTVKGSESNIRKDLKKEIKQEIRKGVAPLKSDIKQLQVAVLENRKEIKRVEVELKDEMHGMEDRLGNKIDKNAIRLDEHETRITTLEEVR